MPPPEPLWALKPVQGSDPTERIELTEKGLSLGRAGSNDFVVDVDKFPHVSSHHARLHMGDDGEPVIEDLGSLNGTLVNGRKEERRRLRDGDVVQLGAHGPQFVVQRLGESPATVMVDAAKLPRRDDLSQTTVFRMRRALGLPEGADVHEIVRSSEGRLRRWLAAGILALIGIIAAVAVSMRSDSARELERLEGLNTELRSQLDATSRAFEDQRIAWEGQKQRLEDERQSLVTRIEALADRDQTASGELAKLRRALAETTAALERYNPVNLEHDRLEKVERVQRAVVFIETKIRYRSDKSSELLRRRQEPNEEGSRWTFDVDAAIYERESSGSGFCVNEAGWIISNAHVVLPSGHDRSIELDEGRDVLRPELDYAVVFSGSDRRIPARVVRTITRDDGDLALLKIEPFAEMPHLADFTTDQPAPPPGAEVYLHGFPLGKMAIQEGNKVIASSFRGILSRAVSSWLQVDAAVHPGNSGGPLTDGAGRVIGVVCRVQRIPEGALAPDMGYAIPVAAVSAIWPPPEGN